MKGPHRVVRQVLACVLGAGLVAVTFLACSSGRGRPHGGAAPLYAWEAESDLGMVASGSVEATEAGVWVLERGGNAVDAAVAAALALGVSDPGGSGLGGMTYVLISLANGHATAIDGSSPVPLAADAARLAEAAEAGRPAGLVVAAVPSTLASLDHALKRYGTMTLAEVLTPAIETAERGFRLTPNYLAWAGGYLDGLLASEYLRLVVLDQGSRLGQPGDLVCRPDLALTLRRLQTHGADDFYRGAIAEEIDRDMAARGGFVRAADLALYRVKETPPLRSTYRGAEVIAFPPPGGGFEVIAALNILQTFPRPQVAEPSVERLHLLVEAFRIAVSDRIRAASDSGRWSSGQLPFLDAAHARSRAALITPGAAIPAAELYPGADRSLLGEHTTQVSVSDAMGNVVALTQTLCRQFGAWESTPGLGFPYNSCLESLDLEDPSSPYFMRPRSTYLTTMAPTIVRQGGRTMALGSAGSDRIPPSVVNVISNVIDGGMSLRDAVVAPRVLWNSANDPPRVCLEIVPPAVTRRDADTLEAFGFNGMYRLDYPPDPVGDAGFFGGVNAVAHDLRSGVFTGVGDPRRGGFALGPRVVAAGNGAR